MNTIEHKSTLPKEIYEVGTCIQNILVNTGKALQDGWQPSQDLPVILSSAFVGLIAAIEGCQNIPEEFSTLPLASSMAIILPVAAGVDEMLTTLKNKK